MAAIKEVPLRPGEFKRLNLNIDLNTQWELKALMGDGNYDSLSNCVRDLIHQGFISKQIDETRSDDKRKELAEAGKLEYLEQAAQVAKSLGAEKIRMFESLCSAIKFDLVDWNMANMTLTLASKELESIQSSKGSKNTEKPLSLFICMRPDRPQQISYMTTALTSYVHSKQMLIRNPQGKEIVVSPEEILKYRLYCERMVKANGNLRNSEPRKSILGDIASDPEILNYTERVSRLIGQLFERAGTLIVYPEDPAYEYVVRYFKKKPRES